MGVGVFVIVKKPFISVGKYLFGLFWGLPVIVKKTFISVEEIFIRVSGNLFYFCREILVC